MIQGLCAGRVNGERKMKQLFSEGSGGEKMRDGRDSQQDREYKRQVQ